LFKKNVAMRGSRKGERKKGVIIYIREGKKEKKKPDLFLNHL